MAGHSQFKNIMHRKGAQDAKRARIFSKISREITVAAKLGQPDPNHNPRLRAAMNTARAAQMPKDNIERAIKKAAGNDGDSYEEVRYEGFGPGGVAIIVESLTDNRNRTASDVRAIFSKNGGNMGASGAVSHGFERVGLICYPAHVSGADAMFEAAVESGAQDVQSSDDGHEIYTQQDSLHAIASALEASLGAPESVKLVWRPRDWVQVSPEDAATLLRLIEALEDNEDVQNVYGNYALTDAVMASLS